MSHAISLEPVQAKSNDALMATIAHETSTSTDLVKTLYEEEVAALSEARLCVSSSASSQRSESNSSCGNWERPVDVAGPVQRAPHAGDRATARRSQIAAPG